MFAPFSVDRFLFYPWKIILKNKKIKKITPFFRSVQGIIHSTTVRWRYNISLTMNLSWCLWWHTSVYCSYPMWISSSMTSTWSSEISIRMISRPGRILWSLISRQHFRKFWRIVNIGVRILNHKHHIRIDTHSHDYNPNWGGKNCYNY